MTEPRDTPFDVYHYIGLVAGCAVLGGVAALAASEFPLWELFAIIVIVVLLWGAGAIAIRRRSGGVGPRVG
jgi:hypothetical protein